MFENLVYAEIKKIINGEIHFHNDSNECDFIVKHNNKTIAIQVCYEVTPANRQRELNGLHTAMEQFSCERGIILSYDQEEVVSDKLQIVPFWKFFFNPYFSEYIR